ncbi:MAG: sugar nucleotide-binding protein, partial [Anaerolineaceae bacterium]|nr:sugar nucleotide-binding protein [Anaerolineaceae bacterium]
MTRFLVTGASGLLGLNFALQVCESHHVVGVVNSQHLEGAPFTIMQSELTQPGEAARLLKAVQPEVVIHCAAMT